MLPRIGVPDTSGHSEAVREAGGEPVPVGLPEVRPAGGVALAREWIADNVQLVASRKNLDLLLVDAGEPEELMGLLTAAVRLDLPAVAAYREGSTLCIALSALGLVPLTPGASQTAIEVARSDGPSCRELVTTFALANALRAGLSAGAGPGLLVHLAALAREADATGFSRMIRVLAPESPAVADPPWLRKFGAAFLLAHLGDALHDVQTVSGRLKEKLPPAPPAPVTKNRRTVFVRGRASGTEAVCQVPEGTEVSGECRVFFSEDKAVQAVSNREVGPGNLLIVGGCGPRGGPGLLKLNRLEGALREKDLEDVPVMTDGLAPKGVGGTWTSLVTPEVAAGGILSRLRDGDKLRLAPGEGRIRTGVSAEEFGARESLGATRPGAGYAGRYARSALTGFEGAGFGLTS